VTTTTTQSRQRRSETAGEQRTPRREGTAIPSSGWSTPLWAHALPAWNGNAGMLSSEAELAHKQDAVRRWRGLPGGD